MRPVRRRTGLTVEPLESRALLSGLVNHESTVAALVVHHPKTIHLSGSLKGTYTATLAGTVPTSVSAMGKGQIPPLGNVSIAGSSVSLTSLISAGHVDLTLKGRTGTLTLTVTASAPPSSLTAPITLSYQITGGSGADRNFSGGGTMILTITPNVSSLGATGQFTMKFQRH
jgi:hypothetical protein